MGAMAPAPGPGPGPAFPRTACLPAGSAIVPLCLRPSVPALRPLTPGLSGTIGVKTQPVWEPGYESRSAFPEAGAANAFAHIQPKFCPKQ